ncbi:SdiA-regulated domain-containing protein [Chryseobacterium sp. MYb264]|uniref:SdiA-regulated domain-containing protein n=1 Tax=Chryseobacterium sp. MYb264 TaxID=2745153 RepID=UPI002E12E5DB|nr:SdiA-regulated domain-containing protein [Chryseobacterium sp. MYb264]
MRKYLLTLLFLSALSPLEAQKIKTLTPFEKINIRVPEPSDIVLHPDGNSFFIVSDNGYLFETDLKGNIIRKADYKGLDNEGVYADEHYVYAVEEFSRAIAVLDLKTLKLERRIYIPYSGGRNSGYEAMTFNKAKGKFLLFTEKNPIYLIELDPDFKEYNRIDISELSRDVSAATFYHDHLWILGDESMTLYKLDPNTYEKLAEWKLPIVNPEGMTFDRQGNLVILSDDMQTMYYFKNPEQ